MTYGVLELRVEGSGRELVPGEFLVGLKGDDNGVQNTVFNGSSCTKLGSYLMIRPLITACGVLAIFMSSVTSLPQPAYAQPSQTSDGGAFTASEEQIGPRIYQVSRVVINAAPNQVQDVITDYEHTEKVFDNVAKCKVVKESGEIKEVAFTIKTLGSLMKCDYVLQIKSTPGRIEWKRLSGAFKANEGFWKFEPANGGRATLVTYAKFVDGGMFAPKFIVNREIRNSMPIIMANLKSTAEHDNAVASKP